MVELIIVTFLVIVGAISKAIQDKIQFHFHESIFKNMGDFWNPETSWKNKYKNNDPIQGEKFLGSKTIFVGITDAWHLFGTIRNFSLISSISIISGNYWLLFLYPAFIGTFHILYEYAFAKK